MRAAMRLGVDWWAKVSGEVDEVEDCAAFSDGAHGYEEVVEAVIFVSVTALGEVGDHRVGGSLGLVHEAGFLPGEAGFVAEPADDDDGQFVGDEILVAEVTIHGSSRPPGWGRGAWSRRRERRRTRRLCRIHAGWRGPNRLAAAPSTVSIRHQAVKRTLLPIRPGLPEDMGQHLGGRFRLGATNTCSFVEGCRSARPCPIPRPCSRWPE
jgi:hypothetical protein